MTVQQQIKQRQLASQLGRGILTFADYHKEMYQFYEA
jgi:hypothetical protein